MQRIKSGDMVKVISGAHRGKVGKVLRIISRRDQVVVEGVNEVHKHLRRSQKHPQGGRITKESPISVSNVMLYDEAGQKAVRVRFETGTDGKKKRVAREDGKVIAESRG